MLEKLRQDNPGTWVDMFFSLPENIQACERITGSDPLSSCAASGFINVSGWSAFDKKSRVVVDDSAKKFDAHFLVGNYYQSSTATAGSDKSTLNTVAEDSICAKGWMLPASARTNGGQPVINPNQSKASFYQLILSYGYPETGGYAVDQWENPVTPFINQAIAVSDPLYFIYGGYIGNGVLYSGTNGYYQSSTSLQGDNYDFALIIDVYGFYPAYGRPTNTGNNVRCVAR